MENRSIINKLLILVLVCIVSLSYAQPGPPGGGNGAGTSGPGARPKTPIDMYEGALMIVATSMIAGYYFVRNRRQIN